MILDEIVGQEIPDDHGKRFLKFIMILGEQPLVDECWYAGQFRLVYPIVLNVLNHFVIAHGLYFVLNIVQE